MIPERGRALLLTLMGTTALAASFESYGSALWLYWYSPLVSAATCTRRSTRVLLALPTSQGLDDAFEDSFACHFLSTANTILERRLLWSSSLLTIVGLRCRGRGRGLSIT